MWKLTAVTSLLLTAGASTLPALPSQDESAGLHVDPATWTEWLLPVRDSVGRSPQPAGAACRLFVREVGDGPRVVFLHGGWGGELESLFFDFLPLADDLRLTFYDQRGSLRSHCDSLPTAEDHVEDLEALRQALGEDRLVLAGHSMGTWLAMAYAERYPQHVEKLILMAPVWPTQEAPGTEVAARWERPEVAAELAKYDLVLPRRREDGAVGWSVNHRIIFAAVNLHDVTKWRDVRPPWDYATDAANSSASSMPETYDFRPALAALDAPVLVIQGDDDFLPAAEWAAHIENVRLETVPDAGHSLFVDRPELVRSLVREFALD